MNELSWLLYAASVCGDINFTCGVATVVTGVTIAVCALWGLLARIMGFEDDTKTVLAPLLFKTAKNVAWAFAGVSLVGALVPSSNTLYAIAASEAGERVLQPETASKATAALNAWLDRQIAAPSAR